MYKSEKVIDRSHQNCHRSVSVSVSVSTSSASVSLPNNRTSRSISPPRNKCRSSAYSSSSSSSFCYSSYKSSFFVKVMLFSNASMLCMMLVQGFKTDYTDQTPDTAGVQTAQTKPPGDSNGAGGFFTTERGRQVFLATNTLPSANRFLQGGQQQQTSTQHQQQIPPSPTVDYAVDDAWRGSGATTTPSVPAPAPTQPVPGGVTSQFRPTTSAEHKLYETLFRRSLYQKNVRPVQNHLRSIKVRLGVCVMTIDEIIEKDQTMITSGCIKMKWSDEFLQWSPEAFQNLTWLVMPSTEIWLPDIALVNSPDPYTITRKPAFAEVTNTGQVGYYPSGRFSTRCAISLLFFPFDIQKCELRFESWVYPTQWLHIEPWEQNPIDMKDFYRNHQWDLERVSAIPGNISYDGLDFSTMRFIFYFRRRSLYYSVLSIFPGVLMSILQMFSHTLPVEHPARMTLLTSLFVSTSVLQSSLASQMPKSSDGISLIQMYLMIFSSNLIISMVVTFINMHVWFRVPVAEIPNALRMLRSFLLDTGGTTGRAPDKSGSAPPPAVAIAPAPQPGTSQQEGAMVKRPSQKGARSSVKSSPQKESPDAGGSEMKKVNETGDQPSASGTKTEPADDTAADEETSLIVSYCCGAVKHRTGHGRRSGMGGGVGRRYAGEASSILRRRFIASKKATSAGEQKEQSEKTATSSSTSAPASKPPVIAVVQSVQSQLTDRKERWLRFSMKVDKAFLYAMGLFNTLCPITIFFIVPQFQTYSDGET